MAEYDNQFSELRARAEALLSVSGQQGRRADQQSYRDMQTLIHEMEVHSIELEMQNDELQKTRADLEATRDRYQHLYDYAPVAYFNLDEKGVVKNANIAAAKLLNLPLAKILHRSFLFYVVDADKGLFLHALRQHTPPAQQKHYEFRLRTVEKIELYVQIEISRINAQDGNTEEYRLVASDISERKQLEQQRDMFFSVSSHEMRTPVTNILLALDLLLSTSNEQTDLHLREQLEIAHRGAKRLKNLTEDILELRHLTASSWPIHTQKIDLCPLIAEAIAANALFAKQCKVSLHSEIQSEQACWAEIDGSRIMQVLNNLLSNAIKFSPEGGQVSVSLSTQKGFFCVCVKDQGSGVPKHIQDSIFEPFTQGYPSLENTRFKESKGLGLSISKEIIERMGGRMGFTNNPKGQGGVEFYFTCKQYG